jgi:hypothetical protein
MNMIYTTTPKPLLKKGKAPSPTLCIGTSWVILKTFDFVVANPPFSSKNWTDGFDPSTISLADLNQTKYHQQRMATTLFFCI